MTESKKPGRQHGLPVDLPVLTEVEDGATLPELDELALPDFDFSVELDEIQSSQTTNEPELDFPPELMLEADRAPVLPVAGAEALLDFNTLPSLDLGQDQPLLDARPAAEQALAGSPDVPELSLDQAMAAELASMEEVFAVAELELDDVVPTEAPATDELEIPELALEDVVPSEAETAPTAQPMTLAEPDPEFEPTALPTMPLAESEALPEFESTLVEAAAPLPAETEGGGAVLAEVETVEALPAPESAASAAQLSEVPTLADTAEPTPAEAIESARAELETVELPVEALPEPEPEFDAALTMPAEPPELLVEAEPMPAEMLEPTRVEVESAEAVSAEPLQSISIDSLPRGVLGGGLALAQAEAENQVPSMEDLIRAAERTLMEERKKQVLQSLAEVQTLPPAAPAAAETVAPAQKAPPAPWPSSNLLAVRPVEIVNVAGLVASAAASVASSAPAVRKSYVTLVDEAMLIDSLYDKILPRMKVELSLWLQDALEQQAKHMLAGVMHQLKEDYEMLFSETLRESLRQAIAEMGREDRGENH